MRLATTDMCEVGLPISTGMSSKVECVPSTIFLRLALEGANAAAVLLDVYAAGEPSHQP
jgi:hypothetical protein